MPASPRPALPAMMPIASSGSEKLFDRRIFSSALRAHLLPGALIRVLVRPEAQQAGAVPEAVALDLVVAHLDDELGPQRRLLEAAAAPAVLLREAALGRALEERLDEREDLLLTTRCDSAGADVVEPSVGLVEPEQQGRELSRLRLPANADDDALGAAVL